MHEIPLLVDIGVALTVALFGGLIARRLGLPTILGYLLAGVAIGPFTPGFVGDVNSIGQLAELGVIFLMFGVGLHFSLKDLWAVRDIALPGALGQMALTTLLAFGLTRFWGWTVAAGLVLGLAVSVASTVVLLRGLMDRGWLNTPQGRAGIDLRLLSQEQYSLILAGALLSIMVNPLIDGSFPRTQGPCYREGFHARRHQAPGRVGRARRHPSRVGRWIGSRPLYALEAGPPCTPSRAVRRGRAAGPL